MFPENIKKIFKKQNVGAQKTQRLKHKKETILLNQKCWRISTHEKMVMYTNGIIIKVKNNGTHVNLSMVQYGRKRRMGRTAELECTVNSAWHLEIKTMGRQEHSTKVQLKVA